MNNYAYGVGVLIPIVGIVMVVFIVWITERRKERDAFYRSEILRKIAESPGEAAQSVLELMNEQERDRQIRIREGMKLGGLITIAAGVGLAAMEALFEPDKPAWAVGLIPLLVGAALIAYVLFLAHKPDNGKDRRQP